MKNVHPRILERVLARLPKGSEIIGAMSESSTQSVLLINVDGVNRRTVMPKADVAQYLGSQVVDIDVVEGDSMEVTLQRLSDKYRLFLVKDVDYNVGNAILVFGDAPTVERHVPILSDSISLTGTLVFTARNKERCARYTGAIKPLLDMQQTQIALAGKIFAVDPEHYLSGDQLTSDFAQTVVDYLTELKLSLVPTHDDLAMGTVLDTLDDGISKFLAIKDLNDRQWFIRFEATAE